MCPSEQLPQTSQQQYGHAELTLLKLLNIVDASALRLESLNLKTLSRRSRTCNQKHQHFRRCPLRPGEFELGMSFTWNSGSRTQGPEFGVGVLTCRVLTSGLEGAGSELSPSELVAEGLGH